MRFFPSILLCAASLVACSPVPFSRGEDAPRILADTVPAGSGRIPALPPDDRTRIAEAFRLAGAIGDEIWAGWSTAPFALLLVTPDHEYLIRHPRPSSDFARIGHDSLLGSDVFARPRTFAPGLLATFPFEGVPTVVIGQASATGKQSAAWVLTALHEHFHQLQMSQPGYYAGVDALGLSRGDQTGMWMLNYPFPYGVETVQSAFSAMTLAVDSALAAPAGGNRQARLSSLTQARNRLRGMLSADDDRYLSFQMWQEGVARYTELHVARWAADRYAPSAGFTELTDASAFRAAADSIADEIRRGLEGNSLSTAGRVAFYPAGAATALLLDDVAPGWRARYFNGGFSLDRVMTGPSPAREPQDTPHNDNRKARTSSDPTEDRG